MVRQNCVVRPISCSRLSRLWAGTLGLCWFGLAASSLAERVLPGHTLPVAKTTASVGRLPADRQLRLVLGLSLRNREELSRLLQELYDPASTNYHQYLSPESFAERFGPTKEDYDKVIQFARANKLTITAAHANRLVLDAAGPVVAIEQAFGTTLRLYPHPTERRTFYAPETEPVISGDVPIHHVTGLDNFLAPRPAGLVRNPGAGSGGKPLSGAGPLGAYRGSDFRGAYARGVTLNGAGQMVGLLEFDGFYLADITSYESQTQLPNVPLITVTMDGFDGTPAANNIEVALDIEMAASMAPGLAAIILYEAGPSGFGNDVLNRMATDNLAKQLSSSWTFPADPTTDQILMQLAAQGQSYFNASGDGGAYVSAVSAPADDPNVTVVGGTLLTTTGPGGAWSSEVAWNRITTNGIPSASGGGVSTTFSIPSWQTPVDMTANQGSRTMRNLPDVAAVAEGVWVTYDNGSSESVGGTSCSAPLWAGFAALVNQQAAAFGRAPVGFLNPALYRLGLGAGYSTNFHDIVSGNNTNSTSPSKYVAVPGYDLCTGWGTPMGSSLINSLAPRFATPFLTNVSATILTEGCAPANGALDPGETVTVNFSFKNLGGVKTTNLVVTLLPDNGVLWPSAAQSLGALGVGATASRSFTFTANGPCGSTLPARLQFQDGPANLGTLVYSFTLGKPISALSQTFDSVAAPNLPPGWTSVATTNVSAWVTSTLLFDSEPNAVFADEPQVRGIEDLLSPVIPITSPLAQLIFRQSYNTESDPVVVTQAFDGGLLEIQVGTNDFTDILAAGGSFATGGYTRTISTLTNDDNPLTGRQAWGGNSGGFISTVVNLPASAAGQSVQFKWRFALDTGNFFGGRGWYIDSVSVRDGATCCNPSADVAVTVSATPEPVAVGGVLSYTISLTNSGPGSAYGVSVTNFLPAGVNFASGSAGCLFTNGSVTCTAGTLPAGATTNYNFGVMATSLAPITNTVAVWSFTPDPDIANNQQNAVSTVVGGNVPVAFLESTNLVTVFVGSVTGLTYRLEYKNALTDALWTPILPATSGTGGVIFLADTNTIGVPARFYRLSAQ